MSACRTFVDPRYGGGGQSERATEDLVELEDHRWQANICCWGRASMLDVALVRSTTADEDGNVTMEHEAVFGEMISMAQAARQRQRDRRSPQVKHMAFARYAAAQADQNSGHAG